MFITPNPYSRPQKKIGQIKNIVIHWIGNAGTTAENNAKYFDGLKVGEKEFNWRIHLCIIPLHHRQ